MDRERQEPLKHWEASKKFRKAFSTKYCLAPAPIKTQCSGTIAKAHTVPKSGSLQKIARNGHVYSFIPSLENLNKYGGKLQPELIGINQASTFTGFCSVHDNSIFSKIEGQSFLDSQEQCFLLAYRAICREVYTKRASASLSNLRRDTDRGKPFEQQLAIQGFNFYFDMGVNAGLRDIEHYKTIYDEILLYGDFSSVRAYIIKLDSPPPIMCSAGTFLEQDFEGNQLQDLDNLNVTPQLLNFTSFYGGECGVIVFTWLPECDLVCRPFIDSLRSLPPDRITDGLIRFFFEFCENLHIQPDWWENLSDSRRDALIGRLAASANITSPRNSGCIADDGIRFDNWPISGSKTVGF